MPYTGYPSWRASAVTLGCWHTTEEREEAPSPKAAAILHPCRSPLPDPAADRAPQGQQRGTSVREAREPLQIPRPQAIGQVIQKGGRPPAAKGGHPLQRQYKPAASRETRA
ncbi:hypothetical protein NDU88_000473 [Pleurodeles waltl]|uniref:Uncharacterized protein n=1 Tax=Pleurodeles waltl TaxID=8319 RepID=A0AAV7P426_PLEWA|nr:hypothetical protein NDU88_000473 [Pleurodeles waltl]